MQSAAGKRAAANAMGITGIIGRTLASVRNCRPGYCVDCQVADEKSIKSTRRMAKMFQGRLFCPFLIVKWSIERISAAGWCYSA